MNKNNAMKTMLYKMVRLEGETLNQLFNILGEWSSFLQGSNKDILEFNIQIF